MSSSNSIFTISLDFELYWGVHDKRSVETYKSHLYGARKAVTEILNLFEYNDIHATWATVGFLFFDNIRDLQNNLPESLPEYKDEKRSPYIQLEQLVEIDPAFLFASKLIEMIKKGHGQEIATHTFSHYYCLEAGQSIEDFYHDLKKANIIASETGIELKSLVFPRNQWKAEYLSVLDKLGIQCYRGNEKGWMYRAANDQGQSQFKRAFRLLDAYVNVSGHNVYDLKDCAIEKPYNFPSSRFLRPYSKKLAILDGLKLNRIKNSMTYAAKNNKFFHLWWHPHNFGVHTEKNINFLREIIAHYHDLHNQYGMESLNMSELSEKADAK